MTLVFLLEEASMKVFLQGLLPRLLPGIPCQLIPHEGKSDLEKSIPRKLKAWLDPEARFVVVRDQDAADCRKIKAHLAELCRQAGRPETLVRIACHELEAWYLADLQAVDRAFGTGLAGQQEKAKYRRPDTLPNPSREFERLVPSFAGKVDAARKLGRELELDNPRSSSFAHLLSGLKRLVT